MNNPDLPPPDQRRLAVLAGPTASGKTARALEWAAREPVTIINADASQLYRDIPILSAAPTLAEQAKAPHRLFGTRDGTEPCSAAEWADAARAAAAEAWADGRLPLLVGGTGLYLRTLLDGIAPVPAIDPAVREAVRALPVADAHAALAREDPSAAARLHPHDSTRIARALEVVRATGRPLRDWQAARSGGLRDSVRLEGEIVTLPVPELYARCDARTALMVQAGALEEVRTLAARQLSPDLPVMRAIGVPQFLAVIEGRSAPAEAIAATAQATRNYAKRQRTWFAHQRLL
jgi:tRNA dimethylallyltransferase